MDIGIVGHGFVGKALEFGFKDTHNIYIHDKFKKETLSLKEVLEKATVIFFCLPTPFDEETMHIDLTIYDEVIKEASDLVSGKIFVIKSTVIPETTNNYQKLYPNNNYAFNPEFLTEKNANEDFLNSSRIVLGGHETVVKVLENLYRQCDHFKETTIVKMSTTEAEVVKYQANVILATRVAISNYFYDVCQETGCDYNKVREGVITDPRIGESHSAVTSERGFGGKCFVKDLAAIIGKGNDLDIDTGLVQEVYDYNGRIRDDEDWKDIPGALSTGKQYSHSEELDN
jgi:UDPglucose 6-dehydrogenase